MAYLLPLTELDAVNELLKSIGQSPVNTLAVSGIKDMNLAKDELAKVSRAVQLVGFAFNTDRNYKLTPDIDGLIKVPSGALKISAEDRSAQRVQRRHAASGDMAMWNGNDNTFTFTEAEDYEITWGFVFDDLPPSARNFITISAARKFQAVTIGSSELDGFKEADELKAWATLLRDERRVRKTNLFTANATLQGSINNRSY